MATKLLPLFCILCLYVWETSAVYANVSQLISQNGYPVENYWFETTDGFYLSVVRIPHGKNNKNAGPRPAIFLQHGLLDTSATWVMNPPNEGLGYILADAGFDVFLGNVRGNTYSSRNAYYSGSELWNLVDFDNMIAIDLPTMINGALKVSGRSSLIYVGHSQGTLMGFGGFPLQPDLAKKVDLFIALAPVAMVGHVESRLLDFLADLDLTYWLEWLGEEEFLPSDWLIQFLAGTLCVEDPVACADVIFLLCGNDRTNLNDTRMPLYMDHTPGGTSVHNMMHWSQAVAGGKFQMFDYGTAGNQQHYHQATPPPYHPEQFLYPPMAFFTGTNDILADPTDVQNLINLLPSSNKPVLVHNEVTYNHLDFVWGMNANTKIYPLLVQYAQKYSKTN